MSKRLQLLGDFVPDPVSGLRPWTPLGDFRPPDLLCPLPQTPYYTTVHQQILQLGQMLQLTL